MMRKKKTKKTLADKIIEGEKMEISLEQREVYSEILEVLRHMEKKYVDKIPKNLIMFFYDNCSLDYEFRMTKSIGEENLRPKTLDLLALLNFSYWSKNKSKEELIMNYAVIDEKTQAQLNAQLEKENIYTRIDVPSEKSYESDEESNLPAIKDAAISLFKKIFNFIKDKISSLFNNDNR